MRRTRKWAYVQQEASRLAELGLAPPEIAARLELNPSTVQRWMQQGKLVDTRGKGKAQVVVPPASGEEAHGAWAVAVRAAYALDATDEELVNLAQAALTLAQDRHYDAPVRLSAMRTFQGLVKQLALVAKLKDDQPEKPPAPPVARDVPRSTPRTDPRSLLTVQ